MKRLCLFAHYDKDNLIDDYVVFYLEQLVKIECDIIFITVSNVQDFSCIEHLTMKCLKRNNIGYDFMSWQKGLELVENIDDYDQIIFCNDSCYGPVFPLEEVFSTMSHRNLDAWSITDNNQIEYHLQSYFLVFNRSVFLSDDFNKFIKSIKVESSKEDIVLNYEVGLSRLLLNLGFNISSYISYMDVINDISATHVYKDKFFRILHIIKKEYKSSGNIICNIGIFYKLIIKYLKRLKDFSLRKNTNIKFIGWKILLDKKDPFIKVMLLRDNPTDIPDLSDYENIIKSKSDFDVNLIENHLKRVKNVV
ncbi:rhamnan synthesis F family protein [Vibrio spartinae]|uniref:Rhamnan synthesis protein F n=1 Tax=Vibrio spartinae TaxID=1918945 RepID=A0A1N6M2W9_9VIBR|nr:rhamnan synthesis F family protein [Vibrio spartinae]SIO93717.1 Rhamnan synthesis protein F [Vibrio spartinae]